MALMRTDPHQTWKEDHGDETLALDWEIDSDSEVWEIGGFEGRWVRQIYNKFHPSIQIFEPQRWAYEKLHAEFGEYPKIQVRDFGLWVMDCHLPLYHIGTDGASLLNEGARSEVCRFVDVNNLLQREVDLALMNVEGAEYVLLPYMLGYDLMKHIRLFWCQFHRDWVQGEASRFEAICSGLNATHRMKWNYYPTAVAWERR